MVGEERMAQGHLVAALACLEAAFVYRALPGGHVEEFAWSRIIDDHIAVLVHFAHEAATAALVAEAVPRRAVFQIAGDDGSRWKHDGSF